MAANPEEGTKAEAATIAVSSRRAVTQPVWLVVPAVLLLVGVMGLPLLIIVLRSFSEPAWGVQNYVWFFSTPVNITVLQRTFVISAWVTVVCVICAYPYAYAMTAVGPKLKLALILCVLVPFWVSGVVRTLAWVILLQDSGVINSTLRAVGLSPIKLIRTQTGVVIGMAQVLMPFMILPLYSVMKGIDLRLLQAARSLGARPWKAFIDVYLPLSLPGVFAGAIQSKMFLEVLVAEQAGWRFDFVFPMEAALRLALLVVVTAALAGLLPGLRAARLDIKDALSRE